MYLPKMRVLPQLQVEQKALEEHNILELIETKSVNTPSLDDSFLTDIFITSLK